MEKILGILQSIRPEFDFAKGFGYIEEGMLDSFDVITLVSELDAAFGISIDGLEILPQNFNSLDNIVALIRNNGGSI